MDVGRVELRKMSCNSHPTEVLKFSDWDRLQPEDVKLENVNEGWTVEGEQDVSSGCRVVLRCCVARLCVSSAVIAAADQQDLLLKLQRTFDFICSLSDGSYSKNVQVYKMGQRVNRRS